MYNFTDKYGKGVQDKVPDWMEDFFKNGNKKNNPVIIKDLYDDTKNNVHVCSKCGKILVSGNICNSCKGL